MYSNFKRDLKSVKSGFTTIELIATFALALVVVTLLLQVIVVLKDVYVNKVVVNGLIVKRGIMVEKIMDDFDNKYLEGTSGCLNVKNCISFIWKDGTVTELIVDKDKNTYSYNGYVTELPSGSKFGEFSIKDSEVSTDGKRKYLSFSFPIYSNLTKGDYGIHIVYQYDPTKTGVITADSFGKETEGPSVFVLDGQNPACITTPADYSESKMGGYEAFFDGTWNKYPTFTNVTIKYIDDNGNDVTGIQSTGSTTIRYTYVAPDSKVYTRDRKVIYGTYEYNYTGNIQTFTTHATGYYKIEGWGAQGNDGTTAGGKGGYISGTVLLHEGDSISVYVGGQGLGGTSGSGTSGGASGGQGTTIKNGNTTLLVAGGGGGGTTSSANIAGGSGNGSGGAQPSNCGSAGASGSNGSGGGGTGTCSYHVSKTCTETITCYRTAQHYVSATCTNYYTCSTSCAYPNYCELPNFGGCDMGYCSCSETQGGQYCSSTWFVDNHVAQDDDGWSRQRKIDSAASTCGCASYNYATCSYNYECGSNQDYQQAYDCPHDYDCSYNVTSNGVSGQGGSSSVQNGVTLKEKSDGNKAGNGYAKITYISAAQ